MERMVWWWDLPIRDLLESDARHFISALLLNLPDFILLNSRNFIWIPIFISIFILYRSHRLPAKKLAYNVKIQQNLAISLKFSSAWIFLIESSSFRYSSHFIHIFIPFRIFVRIYIITPHMLSHFKANTQIHAVHRLKR